MRKIKFRKCKFDDYNSYFIELEAAKKFYGIGFIYPYHFARVKDWRKRYVYLLKNIRGWQFRVLHFAVAMRVK